MPKPVRVVLAVIVSFTASTELAMAQNRVAATDCPQIWCSQPCCQTPVVAARVPLLTQQIAYRDIQRQEYRQQAYWEKVPVTRMRKVAVDRGHYQMVWVPKMVVQNIPETHYEARIRYRTVAVPVTQRVAELRPALVGCPALPGTPATVVGSAPVGQNTSGVVLQAPEPWIADAGARVGVLPTLTIPSAAASQRLRTTAGPTPASSAGDWQTIPGRSASGTATPQPRLGGYRTAPVPAASRPTTGRKPHSAATRSAANVLRVQRSIH